MFFSISKLQKLLHSWLNRGFYRALGANEIATMIVSGAFVLFMAIFIISVVVRTRYKKGDVNEKEEEETDYKNEKKEKSKNKEKKISFGNANTTNKADNKNEIEDEEGGDELKTNKKNFMANVTDGYTDIKPSNEENDEDSDKKKKEQEQKIPFEQDVIKQLNASIASFDDASKSTPSKGGNAGNNNQIENEIKAFIEKVGKFKEECDARETNNQNKCNNLDNLFADEFDDLEEDEKQLKEYKDYINTVQGKKTSIIDKKPDFSEINNKIDELSKEEGYPKHSLNAVKGKISNNDKQLESLKQQSNIKQSDFEQQYNKVSEELSKLKQDAEDKIKELREAKDNAKQEAQSKKDDLLQEIDNKKQEVDNIQCEFNNLHFDKDDEYVPEDKRNELYKILASTNLDTEQKEKFNDIEEVKEYNKVAVVYRNAALSGGFKKKLETLKEECNNIEIKSGQEAYIQQVNDQLNDIEQKLKQLSDEIEAQTGGQAKKDIENSKKEALKKITVLKGQLTEMNNFKEKIDNLITTCDTKKSNLQNSKFKNSPEKELSECEKYNDLVEDGTDSCYYDITKLKNNTLKPIESNDYNDLFAVINYQKPAEDTNFKNKKKDVEKVIKEAEDLLNDIDSKVATAKTAADEQVQKFKEAQQKKDNIKSILENEISLPLKKIKTDTKSALTGKTVLTDVQEKAIDDILNDKVTINVDASSTVELSHQYLSDELQNLSDSLKPENFDDSALTNITELEEYTKKLQEYTNNFINTFVNDKEQEEQKLQQDKNNLFNEVTSTKDDLTKKFEEMDQKLDKFKTDYPDLVSEASDPDILKTAINDYNQTKTDSITSLQYIIDTQMSSDPTKKVREKLNEIDIPNIPTPPVVDNPEIPDKVNLNKVRNIGNTIQKIEESSARINDLQSIKNKLNDLDYMHKTGNPADYYIPDKFDDDLNECRQQMDECKKKIEELSIEKVLNKHKSEVEIIKSEIYRLQRPLLYDEPCIEDDTRPTLRNFNKKKHEILENTMNSLKETLDVYLNKPYDEGNPDYADRSQKLDNFLQNKLKDLEEAKKKLNDLKGANMFIHALYFYHNARAIIPDIDDYFFCKIKLSDNFNDDNHPIAQYLKVMNLTPVIKQTTDKVEIKIKDSISGEEKLFFSGEKASDGVVYTFNGDKGMVMYMIKNDKRYISINDNSRSPVDCKDITIFDNHDKYYLYNDNKIKNKNLYKILHHGAIEQTLCSDTGSKLRKQYLDNRNDPDKMKNEIPIDESIA